MALRSAVFHNSHARLYAGAGIVAASDEQNELDETRLKLQSLLAALGVSS
jgi:menaquinone-specific isochorismate synthase